MAMRGGGGMLEVLELKKYSNTQYSSPEYNSVLGQAERIIVHAVINESSGTTPTFTLLVEDSSDGENWAEVNTTPPITNESISSVPLVLRAVVDFPHGRFLRFKIDFAGTAPTATMALRVSLKNA